MPDLEEHTMLRPSFIFYSRIHSIIFLVLLLTQHAYGFWILAHSSLTIDRLDPIISPGKVSTHVHTVVGASNFGPTASGENLLQSKCTTTLVQDDKSSYWAPQLYYRSENGSFTLVPILFVNTYYEQRPGQDGNVSAFPPGLRMVAGDPTRTTYDDNDTSNKAVGFVCLDYSGKSSDSKEFPKTNCKDGLRAQVTFPSCWDGKNTDSDDHKSHMSYPEGGNPDNGECPQSHPIKVITLFHEWIFDVNKFEFKDGQKNWVFSFGDDVGYGFHADFVNGWKQDVLEAAIKECTGDLFANVQGCAPFVPSINEGVAKGCTIPSQVDEDVGKDHPIDALPGCNSVPMNMNATCSNSTTPAINGSTEASNITGGSSSMSGASSNTGSGASTGAAGSTTSSPDSSSTISNSGSTSAPDSMSVAGSTSAPVSASAT
ncbi:hypothetical protein ACEPAI_8896 [Sanghuangporus weigelae]